MLVDGIKVTKPIEMLDDEAIENALDEIYTWKKDMKKLESIEIEIDGDEVIVKGREWSPIRRVRRITGYLSELQNFSDAKTAEEAARTSNPHIDLDKAAIRE